MTVRYKYDRVLKISIPHYMCQRDGIQKNIKICQSVPGKQIDELIGIQLIEMININNLEMGFAVESELNLRSEEIARLKKQEIERARYETELAKRRYLRVNPDNRLVADTLESDWNEKLRLYQAFLECYEQRNKSEREQLTEKIKFEIRELSFNFQKVWNNPQVSCREEKEIASIVDRGCYIN